MAHEGGVSAIPSIVVSQTRRGSTPYIRPSELPSARFKYDVWHDLKDNEIYAEELKNPRVRKGPRSIDRSSDSDSSSNTDSDEKKQSHRQKKSKKDSHENWRDAAHVNLSYQNLGDDYQTKEFMKILKLLKSCEELHIARNELRDLSKISLPVCRALNLTSNHISSFENLPKGAKLEHLNLTENDVMSLDGLERFKRLKTLHLTRNPISYEFDYRPSVFLKLPHLEVLDDIPKKDSDERFEYPRPERSCIVA